ncbi:MAG: diguanylate cyclase [Deltaproteobacteria bacterium]|nr:diguanylate cyclase [Deltaproteobacteria bacterium]
MSLLAIHQIFELKTATVGRIQLVLLVASIAVIGLLTILMFSIRKVTQRLAGSEELFRAVFENTAVGLVHVDCKGRMLHANEAFCQMLGYTHEAVMAPGFHFGDIFFSDTARNKLFGEDCFAGSRDNRYVLIEPCRGNHEKLVWVDLYVELINGRGVNPQSYVIATVDVTRQRRAAGELAAYRENLEKIVDERTLELRESEERFRFIAEHNHDVIWMMDIPSQRLTYVSPAVAKLRGMSPDEAVAQSPWAAFTDGEKNRVKGMLEDALKNWDRNLNREEYRSIETQQLHKDGHVVDVELVVSIHPDDSGNPSALLGVTHDITERKRAEDELRRLAFYDGLTRLPNRRLLYDRLRQAIRHARRRHRRIALLFIDLDDFKPVNDELGHHIGDRLLSEVANRLLETLRAYDTAARMGGDEFVILLPDLADPADAMVIAERVRIAVQKPFHFTNCGPLQISASIGVALFPDHADSEHELMRLSDDTMYQAKRAGRNRVEMLSFPDKDSRVVSWASPEQDSPLVLSWRSIFESGDPVLDAEHRNLFELANQVINAAMTQEHQPAQFFGALEILINDISEHFTHEEQILEQQKWPLRDAHAERHQRLLIRASQLRNAANRKELPFETLVDFLAVEVVVQHILTEDRQYFSCLKENAIN